MEQVRLNKYLAKCGVCSRREADKLIEQGVVTVDGHVGLTGQTVRGTEEIRVRGKLLEGREERHVLAFYKPMGVTCTEKDPHAEKKINDMISYPVRLTYAGRLDKDSEGLLLLTNDGDLINAVMRGANRHEKEYLVKVNKEITDVFLQKMTNGIYLRDLDTTTRECEIQKIGKFTFQIILTQGLNRQIRRMCQACGYQVKSLKRVRVMNISLGNLRPGEYREVVGEELEQLYADAGRKMI
ncbi:MAG: pseudouridine synthase [Acetatifactor sp.]|nr:pseudouridine synthase [Acetatifactor sp.]